jgi:hypothetical protein
VAAEGVPVPVVKTNTVSNAQYGVVLDGVNGTASGRVMVQDNNISDAQFGGVGLYSDYTDAGNNDDYINVATNTIGGTSPYDNIDACSDYNRIAGNTVSDSSESGIHLDAECTEADNSTSGVGNTVTDNQIRYNCVGVLSGQPPGENTIGGSNVFTGNDVNFVYNSDSYSCDSGVYRHGAKNRHPLSPAGIHMAAR